MNDETKKELGRIIVQFAYWGIFAVVTICAISAGAIKPSTEINATAAGLVEERLNLTFLAVDLVTQLAIAGICALLITHLLDVVREEISRSFYVLGTFSFWLTIVLHVYAKTYPKAGANSPTWLVDGVFAFMALLVSCIFGFGLFVLQGRKLSTPASMQSQKSQDK